jgi:hypothetical protein
MPFSRYGAKAILDAIGSTAAFNPVTIWAKLHIGEPGPTCTGNPASDARRMQVSFSTASTLGTMTSTSATTWSSVTVSTDFTFFSLWDSSGPALSGNALFWDAITANPVTTGDTFTIGAGDFDLLLRTTST